MSKYPEVFESDDGKVIMGEYDDKSSSILKYNRDGALVGTINVTWEEMAFIRQYLEKVDAQG